MVPANIQTTTPAPAQCAPRLSDALPTTSYRAPSQNKRQLTPTDPFLISSGTSAFFLGPNYPTTLAWPSWLLGVSHGEEDQLCSKKKFNAIGGTLSHCPRFRSKYHRTALFLTFTTSRARSPTTTLPHALLSTIDTQLLSRAMNAGPPHKPSVSVGVSQKNPSNDEGCDKDSKCRRVGPAESKSGCKMSARGGER